MVKLLQDAAALAAPPAAVAATAAPPLPHNLSAEMAVIGATATC